ncbi:hypothetical protein J4E91_008437 [Alternaria rosae]|nr:hypothetical protein J4E91_008437 [Alternaria rosae]
MARTTVVCKATKVADLGMGLVDCGENVVCYGSDSCCTDGTTELRYVNPLTGEVKDAQSKDADATKTPTWWKVDSVGVLASMRTASASPTVGTSAATPSSSSAEPTSSDASAAASTPTTSPLPSSTSTSNDSNNKSSGSGISAGVGAGIGIGATVAVAIIALLAWLFFRERKKRRALQGKGVAQEPAMQQSHANWKGPNTEYYAHEAPSDGRTELEHEGARYEMDGRARPELP